MNEPDQFVRSRFITNLLVVFFTAATTLLVFSFGWYTREGIRTVQELAFLMAIAYFMLDFKRNMQRSKQYTSKFSKKENTDRDPRLLSHLDLAIYWIIVFILAPCFL